jgi:hypothetical protein
LRTLIQAELAYKDNAPLNKLGHEMCRMYTEMGFPPDMFLAEVQKKLELPLLARVYITIVYQTDFLEHRRKAGVQDKNLPELRRRNVEEIERLIKHGELGLY